MWKLPDNEVEHGMKRSKRVPEAKIRKVVDISEEQYGFRPGKMTTDAVFIVT